MTQKTMAVFMAGLILCSACAPLQRQANPDWKPYVGCTEQELLTHWGPGGDTTFHDMGNRTSMKITWYTTTPGGVLAGYQTGGDTSITGHVLIHIRDGRITDVSYRP